MHRVTVQREQRSLVGIQTKALELAESVDGLIEAINRVSAEAEGSSKCGREPRRVLDARRLGWAQALEQQQSKAGREPLSEIPSRLSCVACVARRLNKGLLSSMRSLRTQRTLYRDFGGGPWLLPKVPESLKVRDY